MGHTWRGLFTDLRCLPAICRHCVDVPCAQQTAVVCAEYDSLSRLPQQIAAKEVARADALARAAQRAKSFGPGMKELERLKVPFMKASSSEAFWRAVHCMALHHFGRPS